MAESLGSLLPALPLEPGAPLLLTTQDLFVTAVAFCAAPIRMCSRCWCRLRGACRVRPPRTPPVCARGRRRLLGDEGRRSRWSPSLDVSPAFCLGCGGTNPSITRIAFDHNRPIRPRSRIARSARLCSLGSERVIKLEEQARVWRLAAFESRPTEGAAPPSDLYRAPARAVPKRARIKG